MPSIVAYLVAAIELVGGLALILGLYTDLVALLLTIVMVVALVYVKWPHSSLDWWVVMNSIWHYLGVCWQFFCWFWQTSCNEKFDEGKFIIVSQDRVVL